MKYLIKQDIKVYLNYLFIVYAFSFPISKAAVNIIELLVFLLWIYEGNWKCKFEQMRSNTFLLVLGLFFVYMLISILWTSDIMFFLKYMGKYHHYLMIPILFTSLDKRYVKYVFSAFIASMFISELMSYGIYFKLFTYGHATPQFPTPFMHHISYSVILAFTSTILLTNFLSSTNRWIKLFDFIFFTTIVTNLFINGGRTGQVTFIVLVFVVFLSYIKHKIKAMLIATSLLIVILFLAYNFSNNFASRINQFEYGISKIITQNDFTGQGGMRAALWIVGTEVFRDNFIIGTGIGNNMKDANKYAAKHSFKARDMKLFADYHNIFINIATELGIIGLFIILTLFYILFTLPFKTKQYAVLNRTFIISFILFSCTHNTLHLMFPMVYFALFSGVFIVLSNSTKSTNLEIIKKQ